MGTLASASSALYQPLDILLGSPASVRVLRVLARHGDFLTANAISLQARLNRSGVGRTLDHLVTAGIVERVGQGRSILFRFADQHPLAGVLTTVFQAERDRVDHFVAEVQALAATMTPPPLAVWQFGSTARREDRQESDFDIAVVWGDGASLRQTGEFIDQLDAIGKRWAIRPSVIDFAVGDIKVASAAKTPFWQNLQRDYVRLFGRDPDEVARG